VLGESGVGGAKESSFSIKEGIVRVLILESSAAGSIDDGVSIAAT